MNSLPILVAIFFGPVSALMASRALDWLREKKKARLALYYTAMSYRATSTWLHPDSLRALNNIDIVFSDKKDAPVRDAWAKVIAHAYTKRPDWVADQEGARQWDARLLDLRSDLYRLLSVSVGRDLSLDYIKTHIYYPEYHVNAELEWLQIRKQLSKILSDSGLKVTVEGQGGTPAPAPGAR
jgi:hypothetical protein